MTISYHWRIADLERKVEDGYVFTAHYVTDAKDHCQGDFNPRHLHLRRWQLLRTLRADGLLRHRRPTLY
jgi:hypothetical protein